MVPVLRVAPGDRLEDLHALRHVQAVDRGEPAEARALGGLVDMVWLAGGATVCIDGAYFDTLSSGKAARGEGERRVLCVTFRHLLRKSKRLFDLSVYCDPLPVAKE